MKTHAEQEGGFLVVFHSSCSNICPEDLQWWKQQLSPAYQVHTIKHGCSEDFLRGQGGKQKKQHSDRLFSLQVHADLLWHRAEYKSAEACYHLSVPFIP